MLPALGALFSVPIQNAATTIVSVPVKAGAGYERSLILRTDPWYNNTAKSHNVDWAPAFRNNANSPHPASDTGEAVAHQGFLHWLQVNEDALAQASQANRGASAPSDTEPMGSLNWADRIRLTNQLSPPFFGRPPQSSIAAPCTICPDRAGVCQTAGLHDQPDESLLQPGTRLLVYGPSHVSSMFLVYQSALAHAGVLLDAQHASRLEAPACPLLPAKILQATSTENSSVTLMVNNPIYQGGGSSTLSRISEFLEAGAFTHILFMKPHEPVWFSNGLCSQGSLNPINFGDRAEGQCRTEHQSDDLQEVTLSETAVDFDGCMRQTDLWKTFERYASTSRARLVNVVPHYVNQDMKRLGPNSVAFYPIIRKHPCITACDCPTAPCPLGLQGHTCVVICSGGTTCSVGPAAKLAAAALQTVYGKRPAVADA